MDKKSRNKEDNEAGTVGWIGLHRLDCNCKSCGHYRQSQKTLDRSSGEVERELSQVERLTKSTLYKTLFIALAFVHF